MRTRILIKIDEKDDYIVGTTIWPEKAFIENQNYHKRTKPELLDSAKDGLLQVMKKYGTDYIKHQGNNGDFVRCPDSKVVLPIDSFYCKHDDELCLLGSRIFKNNKQNFIKNCRIKSRKDGIWNAIEIKRYEGFHHVPGRYLCPSCEKKNYNTKNYERRINFNYHYPWELCQIGQFLDSNDIELRKDLIRQNIDRNVYSVSLCTQCSIEILGRIGIKVVFEIIETSVYR